MAKYAIGTKVLYNNKEYIITDIDSITMPLPYCAIKDSEGNIKGAFETSLEPIVTTNDLLRYGEYLVDRLFGNVVRGERIRIIKYMDRLWYIEVYNGEVVVCKKLK